MNRAETARLLAAMAAFDRRTVGDADVIAWQAVLEDVDYEDALLAVRQWYTNNTEWIMPAHVRHFVTELRRARAVSPWAPGQYGVPRDQAHPQIAGPLRVEDLPEELRTLLDRLPPGSRAALHPRRVAWEREHRAYVRQQGGEPNPHYDPTAAEELREYWTRDQTGSTSGTRPLDEGST